MATFDDQLYYDLKLDLSCNKATQTIRMREQDAELRKIRIQIYENGEEVDFGTTNATSAMFFVQRPDNQIISSEVYLQGSVSQSHQYVTFICSLTNEQIHMIGRCIAELRIYCGANIITTQTFYIDVEGMRQQGVTPLTDLKIVTMTKEEYEAIWRHNANTLYIAIDYESNTASMYIGDIPITGGGGYNEVQTDTVTDSVEEVTTP